MAAIVASDSTPSIIVSVSTMVKHVNHKEGSLKMRPNFGQTILLNG